MTVFILKVIPQFLMVKYISISEILSVWKFLTTFVIICKITIWKINNHAHPYALVKKYTRKKAWLLTCHGDDKIFNSCINVKNIIQMRPLIGLIYFGDTYHISFCDDYLGSWNLPVYSVHHSIISIGCTDQFFEF